jgi:hypothetical protein
MSSVVWDDDVCHKRKSSYEEYKKEVQERERRYQEIIRETLEKYHSMIDKAKLKQQIRAGVMQVLKEAMKREIPHFDLSESIRNAIKEPFYQHGVKSIFVSIFTNYHFDEELISAINKLTLSIVSVARGHFKDTVDLMALILLEIPEDDKKMDEILYEEVKLAEVSIEYDAEIRKQYNKYPLKVLRIYDVDVIIY